MTCMGTGGIEARLLVLRSTLTLSSCKAAIARAAVRSSMNAKRPRPVGSCFTSSTGGVATGSGTYIENGVPHVVCAHMRVRVCVLVLVRVCAECARVHMYVCACVHVYVSVCMSLTMRVNANITALTCMAGNPAHDNGRSKAQSAAGKRCIEDCQTPIARYQKPVSIVLMRCCPLRLP